MNKIRLGIADDNKDFCDILIDFFNAQENIEIVFVAHDGMERYRVSKNICRKYLFSI